MNVNFEELLKKGIADFRMMEQKQEIVLNSKNKVDKSLINLDIHLANLIDSSKRCSLKIVKNIDKNDYKEKLSHEFSKCLNAYFLLANLKNWNDVIISGNDSLVKVKQLSADQEISKTYLILKKTLYNAFFNHSKDDFNRSWKLFLKLCFVDLNLTLD